MRKLTALALALAAIFITHEALAFPGGNNFFPGPAVTATDEDSSATDLSAFTAEAGEPAILGNPATRSAWWSWTPPASGLAVIEGIAPGTAAPPAQVFCAMFTGSSVASLTLVKQAFPAFPSPFARLLVPVTTGTNYRIKLDSSAGGIVALRIRLIPQVARNYAGIVISPALNGNAFIEVARTAGTAFTAKVTTPAGRRSFLGVMDARGRGSVPMPGSSLTAPGTIELDFAEDAGGIDATLEEPDSTANAFLATVPKFTPAAPAPIAGYYTIGLPSAVGNGFLAGRISPTGSAKFSGRLVDGTKLALGSRITTEANGTHRLALFASLHKGKGFFGFECFVFTAAGNPVSNIENYYLRPAAPGAVFMPAGFSGSLLPVIGGRYTPPAPGQRATGFRDATNGAGKLAISPSGIELMNAVNENFTFGTNNKFTFASPTRKPVLIVNPKTGLVTGSIFEPASVKRTIYGALLGGGANLLLGHTTGTSTNLSTAGLAP